METVFKSILFVTICCVLCGCPGGKEEPVANFFVSFVGAEISTSGVAGSLIHFTDQSTGNIQSRVWNFGDGSNSWSGMNPTHTYSNAGIFTVSLTVSGPGGSNTASQTLTILTAAPVANFSIPSGSFDIDTPIQFTDNSIGSIESWSWDFGDGNSSDDRVPTHSYSNHGTYDVRLTVAGMGGNATVTKTITVLPPPPVAVMTVINATAHIDDIILFSAENSTGVIDSWFWEYNGIETPVEYPGLGGFELTHSTSGSVEVFLTVSGPGGIDTVSQTVTFVDYPQVSVSANPTTGPAPLSVSFNSSTYGDVGALTDTWYFGDGNSATGPSVTHTFQNPGTYIVLLEVVDELGFGTTQSVQIVVLPPPPDPIHGRWVGEFIVSGGGPCGLVSSNLLSSGLDLTFGEDSGSGSGLITGTVGELYLENGVWISLGNESYAVTGSVSNTINGQIGTLDLQVALDLVSRNLLVGNGVATLDSIVSFACPISLEASQIVASFYPTPSPENTLVWEFTSTSIGDIDSYSWDFGDGTSPGIGPTVTHEYSDFGTYVVTLVVEGEAGPDTTEVMIELIPDPIVGTWTGSWQFTSPPETHECNDGEIALASLSGDYTLTFVQTSGGSEILAAGIVIGSMGEGYPVVSGEWTQHPGGGDWYEVDFTWLYIPPGTPTSPQFVSASISFGFNVPGILVGVGPMQSDSTTPSFDCYVYFLDGIPLSVPSDPVNNGPIIPDTLPFPIPGLPGGGQI